MVSDTFFGEGGLDLALNRSKKGSPALSVGEVDELRRCHAHPQARFGSPKQNNLHEGAWHRSTDYGAGCWASRGWSSRTGISTRSSRRLWYRFGRCSTVGAAARGVIAAAGSMTRARVDGAGGD